MANGNCRVPGCVKQPVSRGLCGMHVYRATKGKPGPERDEAIKYALPPTRGPDRVVGTGEDRGGMALAGGTAELKKQVAKARRKNRQADAETDPLADAAIAAVTGFATVMGIRRVKHAQGFLFVGDDDTTIVLTKEGELREATLTVGNVLRLSE